MTNTTKVYLSAPFSQREYLVSEVVPWLRQHGYEVTSHWLKETNEHGFELAQAIVDKNVNDEQASEMNAMAQRDLQDIIDAEIFIRFALPFKHMTGSRYVEFGYGCALSPRLLLVGPAENLFDFLDGVERYSTWEDTKKAL